MRKIKYIYLLPILLLLSSCEKPTVLNTHIVAGYYSQEFGYLPPMNTVVTLKMYYQSQYQKVVSGYDKIINDLSKEVDRYHDYENIANIKTINDSCGNSQEIILSDSLFELISLGVDLTKITKGAFNIAMGNLIDLYAPYFDESSPGLIKQLPAQNLIDNALDTIPRYSEIDDYIILNKDNKSIILNKYHNNNIVLSLGAIAKGFVMQKAFDYLKSYDYPSIIDAGSSTMATLNDNPLKKDKAWTIGFQKPVINDNDNILATIKINGDYFISTSGDYRLNFFYLDDNNNQKLMHHIIDPDTGISNNYVRSVTLISKNANLAILDAISTAIFNYPNIDDVNALLNDLHSTYNVDIDYLITKPYSNSFEEYSIELSNGFNGLITSSFDNSIKEINII